MEKNLWWSELGRSRGLSCGSSDLEGAPRGQQEADGGCGRCAIGLVELVLGRPGSQVQAAEDRLPRWPPRPGARPEPLSFLGASGSSSCGFAGPMTAGGKLQVREQMLGLLGRAMERNFGWLKLGRSRGLSCGSSSLEGAPRRWQEADSGCGRCAGGLGELV